MQQDLIPLAQVYSFLILLNSKMQAKCEHTFSNSSLICCLQGSLQTEHCILRKVDLD